MWKVDQGAGKRRGIDHRSRRSATHRALHSQHDACGRQATWFTSRTTMVCGARPMAVEAGTNGPKACRRPSAFQSAFIRAIRIPSGRCQSTATWPGVFHPMQPQRSGGHAMAGKAGTPCAKVCRSAAASSLCSPAAPFDDCGGSFRPHTEVKQPRLWSGCGESF